MSFYDFLSPIPADIYHQKNYAVNNLGYAVKKLTNENQSSSFFENIQIAIVGVEEDRSAVNNKGSALAANEVRKHLYLLNKGVAFPNIADLGNIKQGHTVNDTYVALSLVVSELVKLKIVPIIIGGSQDLTYAQYLGYELLKQTVDLIIVDSRFDILESTNEINSNTYLHKIILHQPSFLFNVSVIGYQTYFVDDDAINTFEKLYFDMHRLGKLRANIEETEPLIRNADLVSFDISAIRQQDAPGNNILSPNGLYADEACQIARYAGMSDKLTSIGFYEFNPPLDNRNQTAMLLAQMIWCFAEGFANRKNDMPLYDKSNFIKYTASLKNNQYQLVYYKSKKSDKWWMEVKLNGEKSKYSRHHLIPCSYEDYQSACKDEMPERWWQAYQKLC